MFVFRKRTWRFDQKAAYLVGCIAYTDVKIGEIGLDHISEHDF